MTTESNARLKRAAAGTIATAVALSAFGIAATPAIAAPSTVRVHLAEIGEEGGSYPANKFFFGGSDHVNTGGSIVDDKLVLKRKTQVLTELKGADKPSSVAEIIDEGLAVDVADDSAGGAGLQIALGWTGGWTTLRPEIDVDDLDVDDIWISSKPIGGAGGPTTGTLGELADAVDDVADGSFAYAAVGIFADAVFPEGAEDTTTTVDSLTVADTTYTFASGLPSVAKTTKVQLDEIADETEAGYPDAAWFFGTNAQFPEAAAGAAVTGGNLVLKPKTQLLTELSGVTSLRSVAANGLAVTTTNATAGDATLQIAAGWTGGWATLRPAATVKGENAAEFDDAWISSRALPGGVTTGTLDELVTLIDTAAAGSFAYVAVGAFADDVAGSASTTISSFQIGTEKTTFADESKIVVSNVAISGVVAVGNTLTASYSANYAGTTPTYQWYRNGKAISKATASTFKLTSVDRSAQLSVKVTAKKSGYAVGSATSAKTVAVAAGTLVFATPATLTGETAVGKYLTASAATAQTSTYTYQWYRDGALISTAKSVKYKLVAADLGKAITVKVAAKKTAYTTAYSTSAPTAAIELGTLNFGLPKITGTAKVGSTLTVTTPSITAGTIVRYVWLAQGEDPEDTQLIQLSTSKTLKITKDLKGMTIVVVATGVQAGYESGSSEYSSPTKVVK